MCSTEVDGVYAHRSTRSDRLNLQTAVKPASLSRLLAWLKVRWAAQPAPATDRQRALDLIAAINAGGLPLHPARVNHIARGLGLDVSARARVDDTVLRIRAALQR